MSTESHVEPRVAHAPGRSRLALLTVGAVVVGTLITVGVIMPAEYNVDPLGIGRLTGLDRLWAPPTVAYEATADGKAGTPFREASVPYREDVVMIPVRNFYSGAYQNELEYKVAMKAGATMTFSWEAANVALPDDLFYEFHGHTLQNREEMTVASYEQASKTNSSGTLTAPFEGVHGWYFQNSSDKDAVIALKISGFYELIPPGEVGNLGGVIANVPVEQALADQ
jgi:hypothetical protein